MFRRLTDGKRSSCVLGATAAIRMARTPKFHVFVLAPLLLALGGSAPSSSLADSPPVLSVSGETLKWTAAGKHNLYRLASKHHGERKVLAVKGRTFTPEAIPHGIARFEVKAAYGETGWSKPATIRYGAGSAEEEKQEEREAEEQEPPAEEAEAEEGEAPSEEGEAPSEEGEAPAEEPITWEGFSALNPMPAGRRPGDAASPFNQPINNPQVLPNSAEIVAQMLSEHTSGASMPASRTRPGDGPRPMYYASDTDPVVELVATQPWGANPLTGRKIRVPALATAEQQSDGHLTVVLAPNDAAAPGETVDLWEAQPVRTGKLLFGWGGPGNIEGSLLQSDGLSADAADFDLEAGLVRGPELKAGIIPHALIAAVKGTKPTYVYPASHSDGTSSNPDTPAMGQRFYLDYSDAEIAALPVLPWKKTILTALAHYGFFVGDSGNETVSFMWEGSLMYTPFGAGEPFSEIGREQGVPGSGGTYTFNLAEGVNWSRLRAVAP